MDGTTFAEALDKALRRPETVVGTLDRHEPGGFQPSCTAAHILHSPLKGIPVGWAASRYFRPAAVGPVRVLAPAERHAFDELVGLGARLREDFTPIELRSAFRTLARRYHPDRCPGRTPADQAHAARIFSFIVGHYRCLAGSGAR